MIVLEIQLRENLAPAQLPELLRAAEGAVPAAGTEPVVVSGRLPVWAFAALVHAYHPRPWVATFDPRLGGTVVVERHVPDAPPVGAVLSTEDAQKVAVQF
jgi:CRISPR-associated Csx3 family protein